MKDGSKPTILDKNEPSRLKRRQMATAIAETHYAAKSMSPEKRKRQREHIDAHTEEGFCERYGLIK